MDGVGDIWTIATDANGQTSVEATNGPNGYSSILDSFYVLSGPYTAVAAHGPWIAFGATNSVSWALSGPVLSSSPSLQRFGSSGNPGQGVLAMTFDNNGNLYYATNQGFGLTGIWFVNIPGAVAPSLNLNIAYQPSGIAVDSIHGRLYISNASTNKIEVYSTSTWLLLTTIE